MGAFRGRSIIGGRKRVQGRINEYFDSSPSDGGRSVCANGCPVRLQDEPLHHHEVSIWTGRLRVMAKPACSNETRGYVAEPECGYANRTDVVGRISL